MYTPQPVALSLEDALQVVPFHCVDCGEHVEQQSQRMAQVQRCQMCTAWHDWDNRPQSTR